MYVGRIELGTDTLEGAGVTDVPGKQIGDSLGTFREDE